MNSNKKISLLINKSKRFRILYLTKVMLIKHLVNPLWVFLGYGLPIVILIILYFQNLSDFNNLFPDQGDSPFPPSVENPPITNAWVSMRSNLVWLVGILLIPVCYFGIISFSLVFGSAKSLNLTKIYSTLNISPEKYFLVNFIINLIQTVIVVNVILLIYNFLMVKNLQHLDNFMIPASQYFAFVFIAIFAFFLTFGFSVLICIMSDRASIILSIAFLYYLICLTTSGTLISSQFYDLVPNNPNPWFKWLQYVTPIGSMQRLSIIEVNATWYFKDQEILITPNNYFNYTEFTTWSTDWLAFVSPIVQSVVLWTIVFKFGVWRYHRDINTKNLKEISEIIFEKRTSEQVNIFGLEKNQNQTELNQIYTEIKLLENQIHALKQKVKALEKKHNEIA